MLVSQTTPAEPEEVTKPPEEETKVTAEVTEPPVEKTMAPKQVTEPPEKTTVPLVILRTQPVTTRAPKPPKRRLRSMCLVLLSYHNLSIGNTSTIDSIWI